MSSELRPCETCGRPWPVNDGPECAFCFNRKLDPPVAKPAAPGSPGWYQAQITTLTRERDEAIGQRNRLRDEQLHWQQRAETAERECSEAKERSEQAEKILSDFDENQARVTNEHITTLRSRAEAAERQRNDAEAHSDNWKKRHEREVERAEKIRKTLSSQIDDGLTAINKVLDRAETAERERDEARDALRQVWDMFNESWAGMYPNVPSPVLARVGRAVQKALATTEEAVSDLS